MASANFSCPEQLATISLMTSLLHPAFFMQAQNWQRSAVASRPAPSTAKISLPQLAVAFSIFSQAVAVALRKVSTREISNRCFMNDLFTMILSLFRSIN
jgi:hypothetical protein